MKEEKNMKNQYESPVMEVVAFEGEDIVTTSTIELGGTGSGGVTPYGTSTFSDNIF